MTRPNAKQAPYPTGYEARAAIRAGDWKGPTSGLAPGYVQANLVVLPEKHALDFIRFCISNPKPCPLLDITSVGSPSPGEHWAKGADLRTDLPRYRVYREGEVDEEREDIAELWSEDSIGILLGCSFSFESAMLAAGLPVRHIELNCNVPMFRTNRACHSAGVFQGPMVVSMRPIPMELVPKAVEVTSRYPAVHGGPVHVGDPEKLGIHDLQKPDYGDPVPIGDGEVPVFWACGVTPQAAAEASELPWMVTHAPGHMFITDRLDRELSIDA